ncbi:hypothetical protein Pmani_020200 [Petrolisthes manimaculis]|uniref:MADF domain-containing protein n=1 Tax=Petrolisthes manimaculis TaxID=1843537 RepID=A0AAE1U3A8_9EUCA|nr:hypothetical protein Pmani_020200 [Petrolisthes manimaculis]
MELQSEYPELENNISTAEVLKKFTYLQGNFQKMWRKVTCTPSGTGGNVTPKWEYFSACSFLKPMNDGNNEASFQLPSEPLSEVVFEGSVEDLLEDQGQKLELSPIPWSNSNSITSNVPTSSSPIDMITPEPPAQDIQDISATCSPPAKKVQKTEKQLDPFEKQLSTHLGSIVAAYSSRKSGQKDPKPVFIADTLNSFINNIPINRQKHETEINAQVLKIILDTQQKINNELETQGN